MYDITFSEIVEKTKRMLGENYRGDKEVVPNYSELMPIVGHTDSFSVISNDGFSQSEILFIQESTKNYAWWIANHGYIVDSTKHETPALLIFGSEAGNKNPDVLNFTGDTMNGFYKLINRTDKVGNVNSTECHMITQFIKNSEVITFESDVTDLDSEKQFMINGEAYEVYSGRLSPEDKKINDNNVIYPIQLISNLDYYYIPMIGEPGKEITGAHNFELKIQNNLMILEDVCEMVTHEAAQWTNRPTNERLIEDCWPVIVKCACIAYLNRGAEGLNSQSELGQQNVYTDWVALMHSQIMNRRYII